ncbi:hypothetical protein RHGRI_028985 [Rhododendron griersonianum]|uniref:Uncharacterized protein n=1 Tax=Rhododendron griersonianum TaxID=479676 RepID=A0AAV6INF6_9ERIC|nr:hypothetical protein RHGRI_028985 [Rhododendron griersonianum]
MDEFEATVLDDDVDGGGAGVEVVLDQLLHGRDWPLDHFSGGDLVHHGHVQFCSRDDDVTDRHKRGWWRWAVECSS